MITIHANGLGGSLGDELVTETELYTSGLVYYVYSGTGDDTNDGFQRQKPLASLVHAITLVNDCDIIVLLDGHEETIPTTQTLSKNGLKIVAEGNDDGAPTVTLSWGNPALNMFNITGDAVTLGNISFPKAGSATSSPRVNITGTRSAIRGCVFEVGDDDQSGAVYITDTARGARVFHTSVTCVAETTPPIYGILMSGAVDVEFEAVTFDGGTTNFRVSGFLDTSAIAPTTAPERFRAQQMRFLNGAGFITSSDTTGYVGIAEKSGSVVVQGFSNRLPSGFRQTGDALLADTEFYYSGTIRYVHYGRGNDGNSGLSELAPKKTIMSAVSASVNDCDFIVCLSGHEEPLTSEIVPNNNGQTIIGCGISGGNPACRVWVLSGGEAGARAIYVNTNSAYIRNLWVDESLANNNLFMIEVTTFYSEVRGCLVTPGAEDDAGAIKNSGNSFALRETKVQPKAVSPYGVFLAASSDVDVWGVELSNGSSGWSGQGMRADGVITRLYGIGETLSFGADVYINPSSTGLFNPETSSGSALVSW